MSTDAALARFAAQARSAKTSSRGVIAFRLTGKGGGDYHIDIAVPEGRVIEGEASVHPLLEIVGDAATISAVLEGRKGWVSQLYAGGLRIRGDLVYINELARELGVLA